MRIEVDDLCGPGIRALLEEHVLEMYAISPPESVHALDLDGLRKPEITFWSVHDTDGLVGCGALKELDAVTGELKSMRTARSATRRGVASTLLAHIVEEARKRRYERLYLETGAEDFFAPARALYARFGFEACGPFAGYTDDPNSVYLTKTLLTEGASCRRTSKA
jgi:putative acetyltransferase